MRKPVQIGLIAVLVLLLGGTLILFQKYQKSQTDYADMKSAEEAARSHYADAFNAIAEIQDSLNAINVNEGAVHLQAEGLRAEQKLTQPNRREALESIAILNASIQRTKDKISQLEGNLKKSGMKIAGLQRMISVLKRNMADKQGQVAELTGRVDSLQTQVAGLQTSVQEAQDTIVAKNQAIEDKRKELGTIYYIVGTKKDLANSGVIVAKGGVLGMGKTLKLSGHYDESRFATLDTDQETTVRTPATKTTKVQVLSPQPTSSYEVKLEGNQVEVHILDPKEFRKVKHLVIMTA